MHNPYGQIYRYVKATGDNAPKLQKILDEHHATFAMARGSQHNHQAWEGGYLQHVADCMSIARMMLNAVTASWPVPFSWSSVVLVLFLHDIEKPFMQEAEEANPGRPWLEGIRIGRRLKIIEDYNIVLTEEEKTALEYIHGEGLDYLPNKRLMNELGALCHATDVMSARLWHSRNKPDNA